MRTLPSKNATNMPPGWGVWATFGLQAFNGGTVWKLSFGLLPMDVGGEPDVTGYTSLQ